MSEEQPSPELRALGAQLFAAGRAERPGPALGRRLSMIEPGALERSASSREGANTAEQRFALRLRGAGAFAAVLTAAAGVWLWLAAEAAPIIVMSPDPARTAAPAPLVERAQEAAAAPEALAPTAAAAVPHSAASESVSIKRAAREHADGTGATRARPAPRPQALDAVPAPNPVPSAGDAQPAPVQAKPLTLLEELGLLKRARSALRSGDAAQALTLLDQHARERGGNGLGAEAALLRIESLATLGRRAAASELATRFVRENPNSALGDRAKSFITQVAAVIKPAVSGHEDAKGAD